MTESSSASQAATVEVLLATYNGARFLVQQVDSILAQDYPAVRILARDDGSNDGTLAILEDYAQRLPGRFILMPQTAPTGSAKFNFVALMQAATADYVCCADQDDVWLPEKISRSMLALHKLEEQHGAHTPLLVFTDLRVVAKDLTPLYPSFWAHQHISPDGIHSFRKLLTQNVVTGCTALFNSSLCKLASNMPPEAYMHDFWIALVACALGHATYLPEPTVLYRQHDANVLGAIVHGRPNLVPRFRYHTMRRRQWESTERQAAALLYQFRDQLAPGKRRLLEAYVRCETSPNRLTRVATLLQHRFFQRGLRPNLAILWYLWDMKAAKRLEPHV